MTLTVTNALLDGRSVSLRCIDDEIEALGPDVVPGVDDEVIDAGGMVVRSPLVNGHTHAAMTLFRGFGDDLPLMDWLRERIWPAEARLSPDDAYWGTRLAALEMIRSGTSHFFDMYWHAEAVARAANDAGIRATVSAVLIAPEPSDAAGLHETARESLDALHEMGPLISPSLGPHAVYTVATHSLAWVGEVSAARNVPVHIHLSETRQEVDDCVAAHGLRPASYLDSVGLLTPRTLVAHGNWLDLAELELVAARGATIVTCPTSNMKLANGRCFPLSEAAALGVPVGLGTDGASSNNSLDMFEQMKIFALAQKHANDDPAILPAADTLDIASGRRSSLMGATTLEPGARADFILIRSDAPEIIPGDLTANLVYAASGAVVDTTVVAGRTLMRDRIVADQDEIVSEAKARAAKVTT